MTDHLKIMPVEICGAVGKCMSSPQSYEREATPRFGNKPGPAKIAAFALQKLEEARAIDVARHEKNLPAIENNKAIRAVVEQLMNSIGMPAKHSRKDTRSRARFPKTITEDAGYIGDLARHVPVSDSFDSATTTYNSLKQRYDAYAADAGKQAEKEAAQAAAAEEARKAERRANLALASIILRYGLDQDAEWDTVLSELRKRDQRLDLAIAMEETRGDWSEGFYRVSDALSRFKIETDEDKAIANNIVSCLNIDGDYGDGRVFRDTTWNYNVLYAGITDQQLVTDARLARERCRQ